MKLSKLHAIGKQNEEKLAAFKAEVTALETKLLEEENRVWKYRNPWYDSPSTLLFFRGTFGPEFFTSEKPPVEYRGLQIFFLRPGHADIVLNDVCLTSRASNTLEGAKKAVDSILAGLDWHTKNPFTGDVMTEEKEENFKKAVV